MSEPITPADCLAAVDRIALKLDALLTRLDPISPVDQAALDQMHAGAEEALSSWRPPPGWRW
jgi:hypothetical protein